MTGATWLQHGEVTMERPPKVIFFTFLATRVVVCSFLLSIWGCDKGDNGQDESEAPTISVDSNREVAENDDVEAGPWTDAASTDSEQVDRRFTADTAQNDEITADKGNVDSGPNNGDREHLPDDGGLLGSSDVLDSSSSPRCGNGRLDEGEVCDDGNQRNGDGCSLGCQCQDGKIVGDFSINNANDLDGFINMISEYGCVVIEGSVGLTVTWVEETGRTDLSGFESLTAVEGNFSIATDTRGIRFPVPSYVKSLCLRTLNGLDNLDHIGGSLTITNCAELTNIDALDDIDYIGCNPRTDINISAINVPDEDVASLMTRPRSRPLCTDGILKCDSFLIDTREELARLSNCVRTSGNLKIMRSNLSDLNGLENLEWIDGELIVFENDSLVSLNGLDNLRSVGGIDIHRNPLLKDIDSIFHVNEGGYIESISIFDNSSLADICDMKFDEAGYVDIGRNALSDLGFLNQMKVIEITLSIRQGDFLSDLKGLDSLTAVDNLYIENNDSLQNLAGLNNLARVTSTIRITGNDSLTSLRALGNVPSLERDLWIRDNLSLPTCEAIWLRDTIGFLDIGGEIKIDGNDDSGICF